MTGPAQAHGDNERVAAVVAYVVVSQVELLQRRIAAEGLDASIHTQRERETDTDREGERRTEGQTERQTERQTDTHTLKQVGLLQRRIAAEGLDCIHTYIEHT